MPKGLKRVYYNMVWRCKPTSVHRKNYADRGIVVCSEWGTFRAFERDMAETWRDGQGLTLDRINNALGYFKDNCRFVTQKVQSNNTRKNHFVTFLGDKFTISELADKLGQKQNSVYYRLKRGWTLSEIQDGHRPYINRKSRTRALSKELVSDRYFGMKLIDIGVKYGLSHSNLSRFFRKPIIANQIKTLAENAERRANKKA
jgi:hypothetical protein